jgi:hypothetical protein
LPVRTAPGANLTTQTLAALNPHYLRASSKLGKLRIALSQ